MSKKVVKKTVKKPTKKVIKRTRRVKLNKGSSRIRIILIVVALIILVGGGFYFLTKSGNSPLSGSLLTPRATEKDFEFIKDPLIRKHFVAMANQTSFRMKMTSTGKDQTSSTTEMQLKGESFAFHSTEERDGKDISQIISIGDTTYIKDYQDSKWWKQTAKHDKTILSVTPEEQYKPEDFKEEFTKKKQAEYKQLGKEPCDDLTCYKYQEVDPENNDGSARIFWFDDSKYLLRKEEYSYGVFKTTSLYSYNNISVNPPSPTKDVPEGKDIYEYMFKSAAGKYGGNAFPTISQKDQKDMEQFQKQMQEQMKAWENQYPTDVPNSEQNTDSPPEDSY